jgi:DNA invertase Pin-like site-specific DNA recombinase
MNTGKRNTALPYNVLRGACYERVSTDEQALRGFSIDTQIDALTEHCEKNNIRIVDHYCDAGVSGGKAAFKRPEMSRLLDDVKAGKVDIILFTRLDRWFRNVKEYFKVQEILDAHGVQWRAIWEDYDTTTSNGRMAITIFLAIAKNEREKTSERIKVVFDAKRKNKEALFSDRGTPFGYVAVREEDTGLRRLVKDPETRDAVQAFWDHLKKYGMITTAGKYVNREYGTHRTDKSWRDIVPKEVYTGTFRGVEGDCEPYISREEWQKIQDSRGTSRATQSGRVYLFSGLIRCPRCGLKMKSSYSIGWTGTELHYYRCRKNREYMCDQKKQVSEIKAEAWLLENLADLLRGEIARVELARAKPKPKPAVNVAKLREELRRLNVAYRAGNMSDDEYLAESKDLNARIAKAAAAAPADPGERDLDGLRELLETDFISIYQTLDPADRRRFWQAIVREIHVNENGDILAVDFL